jgi:hypothetical protein
MPVACYRLLAGKTVTRSIALWQICGVVGGGGSSSRQILALLAPTRGKSVRSGLKFDQTFVILDMT